MISMKVTKLFFDSPKVMRAVDRATREALSGAGKWVKTTAQRSIRKAPYVARKKRGEKRTDFTERVSKPGRPPLSHTGLLKRFIRFAYEPHSRSVVVGPVKLHGTRSDTALRALEHGGMTTILRREKGKLVRRKVRVKPRPFMQPAIDKAVDHDVIPKQWRGTVRGS